MKQQNIKNLTTFGFTLAEVMIVVVIIGVVAALVLPSFIQDFGERINSHRQANIAQKITKSIELMTVNGDYTGVSTTEEFVDKLSKYLKIAKVCDNEHLEECWPTKTIKTAKGETYNISNAKTSKDLHTRGTETDNVGLVLADGASLILTFNPDASNVSAEGGFIPYKKALPIGGGKTEEFAYSSNATGAIDFVMDVNGKTGPNAENDFDNNYYDIRSFRTASFSVSSCPGGKMVEKNCIVELGMDYEPLNCTKSENSGYCAGNNQYSVDYWAGANKRCQELGLRIPTTTQWRTFTSGSTKAISYTVYGPAMLERWGSGYLYGLCPNGGAYCNTTRNVKNPLVCIGEL